MSNSKLPDETSPLNEEASWFSPAVRYEGEGHAEFLDPHGYVTGPGWVEFREDGVARGGLTIHEADADEHLPMGLFQLFQRQRPVPGDEPGSLTLSIGLESKSNDCVALVIVCPDGAFTAHAPIGYGHTLSWSVEKPESTTLTFQLFNGIFLVNESAPKYWVLPLTNFISRYRPAPSSNSSHPLRLRKTTAPPEDGSEQDLLIARFHADQQNRLITFSYKGRPAHIEPLLDHDDRENRLLEGKDRRLATALMVGELPREVRSEEQLNQYLRPDLLHLLSLATGSEVGAPWVELRDEASGLVARVHFSYGQPAFAKGHRSIDETIHGGTGSLLTHGALSDIYDSAMLRVTIKHIVQGGLRSLTIEDRLSHLIRALDGLCKMEGISGHVSVTELLTQQETGAVRKIVKRAAGDVRKLADDANREGNGQTARIYGEVAQRISKSTTVTTGFGADVSELIRKQGLHDLEVVEVYFANNPREDKRDWLAILSFYRGLVMHQGYIDFDRNPSAIQDASILMDHLHDLLIRMIFKRIGYSGKYQPKVIKMTTDSEIDWVKPHTPPFHLGYEA